MPLERARIWPRTGNASLYLCLPRGLLLLGVALLASACATQPARPSRSANGESTPGANPAAAAAAAGVAQHRRAKPASPATNSARAFQAWLAGFRRRARARGVAAATLAHAFDGARFLPHIVELDRRQPEFTRAIWSYLDSAVSERHVARGREMLARYTAAARSATARYGVSRDAMVAIWGLESNYGQNLGGYETIDALATLGYDGRRRQFAENQLYAALDILGAGDIDRARMRGSWAGAMGQTQFLPTSFLSYAVDADGDGRRDIWGSIDDVLASTANYLAENGWVTGSPWGREVVLPPGFDYGLAQLGETRSSAAWRALGVEPVDSRGLPRFDTAAIIAPAGAHGPAFMVGPNFRVIMRYNNATSYALAVGLLADRLAGGPGVQHAWPRTLASLSNADVRELQTRLNALGYAVGTPDGLLGPHTRDGLRAFQRAHGLTADGYPTYALLRKVRAAAGR